MGRTKSLLDVTPFEETIKRLKDELYMARRTIIGLVPEDAQALLESYWCCESRERNRWEHDVVEKIIDLAKPLPSNGFYSSSERAYCPLCDRGSISLYESGFTLREGLRRHLSGWGNARQCDVMNAVMCLARDTWHEKFHASDEAERLEAQARLEQRRRDEMRYRITSDSDPELFEEGLVFLGKPRSVEELTWAEQRLRELDFQILIESNVKSCVSDHESFVVFADPRAIGFIGFYVYKKPLPKPGRRRGGRSRWSVDFKIMDSWKNDIRGKYRSRLAALVGEEL